LALRDEHYERAELREFLYEGAVNQSLRGVPNLRHFKLSAGTMSTSFLDGEFAFSLEHIVGDVIWPHLTSLQNNEEKRDTRNIPGQPYVDAQRTAPRDASAHHQDQEVHRFHESGGSIVEYGFESQSLSGFHLEPHFPGSDR
jgi:hypothetical protein